MRSRQEGPTNIYRNFSFENRVQRCMPITMPSSPKTIGKVSERYMTAIKLKILWKLVGLAWDLSQYFTWQVGESRLTHAEKPGTENILRSQEDYRAYVSRIFRFQVNSLLKAWLSALNHTQNAPFALRRRYQPNSGNHRALTIIFSFSYFCSHSIKTRLAQRFQVSIHMHPSLQSSVGVRKKFYTSLFQWTSEVLVVLVQSSGLIVIACQVKSN